MTHYTLKVSTSQGHTGLRCVQRKITQAHIVKVFEDGQIIEGRHSGTGTDGPCTPLTKNPRFAQGWRSFSKVLVRGEVYGRIIHAVATIQGSVVSIHTVYAPLEMDGERWNSDATIRLRKSDGTLTRAGQEALRAVSTVPGV